MRRWLFALVKIASRILFLIIIFHPTPTCHLLGHTDWKWGNQSFAIDPSLPLLSKFGYFYGRASSLNEHPIYTAVTIKISYSRGCLAKRNMAQDQETKQRMANRFRGNGSFSLFQVYIDGSKEGNVSSVTTWKPNINRQRRDLFYSS